MHKYLLILLLVIFSNLPEAKADGQNIDLLTNKGKAALFSKDFDTAYNAFYQAFLLDPTNLDISFYLGRSAFEKGDYESALMAFDRVLIMNPDAIRVKLEIARCHMRLGALQAAKQYFYEVLNSKPPKPVADNIEIFLAGINASEKKHFISGMLSLGFSLDNNARSAPGDYQLTFSGFAGDITLDLTSAPVDDKIYSITAAINHIYKFEDSPYSWKTTVTNLSSIYAEYKDLDIHYIGLSSGPAFQGNNFLLEFHASLNKLSLGYDEYVQPTGAGGSVTFLLGPNFLLNSAIGIEKKKYSKAADVEKDATNYTASLSPTFIFGDYRLSPTFAKERENADTAYYSYDRFKWGMRYDRTLPKEINIFASFSIKHTDYDAIKTGDSVKRSDKAQDLTLGANKTFWVSADKSKNISMQVSWTYTDAESNLVLYNYRKKVLASLLSYGF